MLLALYTVLGSAFATDYMSLVLCRVPGILPLCLYPVVSTLPPSSGLRVCADLVRTLQCSGLPLHAKGPV